MFSFGSGNLRSTRLKQKRRQRRTLIISAVVIFIVATISGLVALSRMPFITIRDVAVIGNATIDQEAVLETVNKHLAGYYLWLFPKRNIFLYPRSTIEETLLKQFATAKQVSIKRQSFSAVTIELEERQNNALWCLNDSKCFFLDASGYVFASAPVFSSDVYHRYYGVINGNPIGKEYLPANTFTALEAFITGLSSLSLKPEATYTTASGEYEIFLKDGSKIMLNQGRNLIEAFSNLEALWNNADFQAELEGKTLEYLDLRFGNKVFYKLN